MQTAATCSGFKAWYHIWGIDIHLPAIYNDVNNKRRFLMIPFRTEQYNVVILCSQVAASSWCMDNKETYFTGWV